MGSRTGLPWENFVRGRITYMTMSIITWVPVVYTRYDMIAGHIAREEFGAATVTTKCRRSTFLGLQRRTEKLRKRPAGVSPLLPRCRCPGSSRRHRRSCFPRSLQLTVPRVTSTLPDSTLLQVNQCRLPRTGPAWDSKHVFSIWRNVEHHNANTEAR